jgi:hypothetical protein
MDADPFHCGLCLDRTPFQPVARNLSLSVPVSGRITVHRCGSEVPGYDIVNCGSVEHGDRQLCNQCFNAEVASAKGPENFENRRFDPIVMNACAGEEHEFHFRTRLLGAVVAIDAFEVKRGQPAGYQFQIVDDSEVELISLLGRLIERMRRRLSVKDLVQSDHRLEIADRTVRGRIEWDESKDGRVPVLVIDGREVSWEELGRMLMTFEGWQFRMEIRDPSEEV